MDSSVFGILDVIFVGAGIYVLYAWFLMKTKGEIKTSILMSKDINLKKCKDLEAYKAYIAPKMLIFGIASLVYGAVGLINANVYALPLPVYFAVMAFFMAVLIWFAYATRKGVQKFW